MSRWLNGDVVTRTLHLAAMKARAAQERALKRAESVLPVLAAQTRRARRRIESGLVEGKGTPTRTRLRRMQW